jgi:hypothetical protein
MSDFIKLHRCIEEWEWYKDVNTFKLFIHLLVEANWKDGSWKGVLIKRGQMVTSRANLSKQTGLSEREIRTALQHLKTTNETTIKTTKHYTLITVENYEKYQGNDDDADQRNDQRKRQQPTTIEEIKNNNIYSAFTDCPCDQIKELFNSTCKSLPTIQKIGKSRINKLNARWKELPDIEKFKEIFNKVEQSDFLTGKDGKWKCNFDWIIENDKNYCKVLEGNYDNKTTDKPKTKTVTLPEGWEK